MLDNAGNMLWVIGAMVLAVSALAAHRISMSFAIRSAIAWAAIIFVIVLAVSHRYELQAMLAQVNQALGIDDQQVSGNTVRIRMSPDGHFWARASINGVEHTMLIDSGATITALSQDSAAAMGVTPGGPPMQVNTANGPVTAQRGQIAEIKVGGLQMEDLGVMVSPAFGDTDVLGMNFLSRLGSWRVEGRTLILEPGKGGAAADEEPVLNSQP